MLMSSWDDNYPEGARMDTEYEAGPEQGQAAAPRSRARAGRTGRVIATTALAAGMAAGGYGIAHAATSSTTSNAASSSSSSNSSGSPSAPQGNPLDGNHAGPNETLLTGDAATKATGPPRLRWRVARSSVSRPTRIRAPRTRRT